MYFAVAELIAVKQETEAAGNKHLHAHYFFAIKNTL